MDLPSLAQQKGLAFAPLPFAALSFLSSAHVICHLIFRRRRKLERLYHRLVLAMNFVLLAVSVNWFWSPFAVPEGTPYHWGASGTVRTCATQAFLYLMFALTIPTYYGSLSLQAFMGMKRNFDEEKYDWIEKYVHIVAWCIPFAISTLFAATENLNPSGSGCYIANAPLGCDMDPDVPCERGHDTQNLELIVALSLVFLYLIFPPSMILAIYFWISKAQKRMERSKGMQKLRDCARKEAMKNIARQISLYLFSFWFTWVFGLIHSAYFFLTNKILYDLLIFATCMDAMQGFVFAVVYFGLDSLGSLGTPKVMACVPGNHICRPGLTVEDIRINAENKTRKCFETIAERKESYVFNIFDGVADADSPWAKFINEDNDGTASETEGGVGQP